MAKSKTVQVTLKLEEIKDLVSSISEDAQKILSMTQIAIPIGEATVQRIIDRAQQVKRLFTSEAEDGGNG